jgi:hypothetical protein
MTCYRGAVSPAQPPAGERAMPDDFQRQQPSLRGGPSTSNERNEYDKRIKALLEQHTLQHREADRREAQRRIRLQAERDKSLPDVPLHKRGFGVMDENEA